MERPRSAACAPVRWQAGYLGERATEAGAELTPEGPSFINGARCRAAALAADGVAFFRRRREGTGVHAIRHWRAIGLRRLRALGFVSLSFISVRRHGAIPRRNELFLFRPVMGGQAIIPRAYHPRSAHICDPGAAPPCRVVILGQTRDPLNPMAIRGNHKNVKLSVYKGIRASAFFFFGRKTGV